MSDDNRIINVGFVGNPNCGNNAVQRLHRSKIKGGKLAWSYRGAGGR